MFTVRRATPEDSPGIGWVHVRAIRELCAARYPSEEIEAWAKQRDPEHYVEAIRGKEFYVAEQDGSVVGFGTLDKESGEIEAVYVSPDVAGRGVGSEILRKLEERAMASGLKALRLDASLNAIPFYTRNGYSTVRELKHRLTSGVEIACVLMTKDLTA